MHSYSNKNWRMMLACAALVIFAAGCAAHRPHFRLDESLRQDIRAFDGARYVGLEKLCGVYDIDCKWDPYTGTATLKKAGKTIVLRNGSDALLVDGKLARLEKPVRMTGGAVYVPESFVNKELAPVLGERYAEEAPPPAAIPGKFAIKTIVVDAGHGGKDMGATGRRLRLREKHLTLSIAKKLKKILEDNGIRVILTRDRDEYIALSRRADIANRANADLFVSIHVNASRSRSLRGFECYFLSNATDDNARAVEALENASLKLDDESFFNHSKSLDATLWDMTLSENRKESAGLARHICCAVEEKGILRNRGIKSARFYVLKFTRMPSVLVEAGYISNRYDEVKFKDPAFTGRVAETVAKGILDYKREFERTDGFTRT